MSDFGQESHLVRMRIGDSHYGEWRDRLDLQTTIQQDLDALFLESRGKKFLVDFGYENCEAIARDIRRQERGQPQMTKPLTVTK